MTAVLEARPVGGALADDARSGSVRLVRVEAFEPAVYVAPEHRDAYERRFVTLLVDEAEGRKALALVLAAYRSAAEGKPVVL